ncbi:hypothetical protein [Bradyrhizobium sp. HKCCYLS20291]|uniref:hypothetical protein n=1 Tax=Bradyrhizobium sp. HKCCYLS20291 TaxID=3420766 RepID=UPI003EBEC72C
MLPIHPEVSLIERLRPIVESVTRETINLPLPLLVITLAVIGLIGWQLFRSIITMKIKLRGGEIIRRDEQPVRFWLMIGGQLPVLTVFIWIAMTGVQRGLVN